MKFGTENNPKFQLSLHRLRMPLWQMKGLLVSLWDLTGHSAPHGDIGRFTNEQIALAIGFKGDADELVQKLVELRWLDVHPVHRLVVHDWHDHAQDWIKKRVTRSGTPFASLGCLTNGDHGSTTASMVPLSYPCLALSLVPSGSRAKSAAQGFESFWELYPRKQAKQPAMKAWRSLGPNEELQTTIGKAILLWKNSPGWQENDGRFVPLPATWLNQRRWEDEPFTPAASKIDPKLMAAAAAAKLILEAQ